MDQRHIPWGSAVPGANGITGANAWSSADKDEYFRLIELIERADAEQNQEAEELFRKNQGLYTNEWSKEDTDKLNQSLRRALQSHGPLNRFTEEMKKKYKGVRAKKKSLAEDATKSSVFEKLKERAKKKSLAEDATKSFVFEKLKYAPPRLGMPGGPGYEEAKASFGSGRTRRRHRKSRRTRKH